MTARSTPALPFPVIHQEPPKPAFDPHVETRPMIGYRAVRHEFIDDKNVPRMAFEADETVSTEFVAWIRTVIDREGRRLRTRESRRPILGPRLLP